MSYVGVATSVGQVIDVPIVLRSLAESLAPVPAAKLPITYDLGLIATLDCGTNEEQHGRVVNSYALTWWRGTRRPAEGGTLDATTLEACLKHHRSRLLQTMSGDPVPAIPIIPLPTLQLPAPDLAADADADADPEIVCLKCKMYRSLAGNLLNELRSVKNFTSSMVESTLNEIDIASRRTQGYYILHETVQLKEMDQNSINVDGIGPGSQTQKKSRHVREIAQNNLERLRDMPPPSFKWTWGETLTRDEVLNLRSDPNRCLHSGYELSLREGRMRGVVSATNTAPTGPANYSALCAESHSPPPPTSHQFPIHFGSYKTTGFTSPNLADCNPGTDSDHGADSNHSADSHHGANYADSGAKPLNLAATAQLWMEFENAETTNQSSPSNLASMSQLWIEMESANTASLTPIPTHQSAAPSHFEDIAHLWLEIEQPCDPLAATRQLWLDMEVAADSVADPECAKVANPEDEDNYEQLVDDDEEKTPDDSNEEGDEYNSSNGDNNAHGNRTKSQQSVRRAYHLANLTLSPSKLTLSRREFTPHDFFDVPVEWFSDEECFDADE